MLKIGLSSSGGSGTSAMTVLHFIGSRRSTASTRISWEGYRTGTEVKAVSCGLRVMLGLNLMRGVLNRDGREWTSDW